VALASYASGSLYCLADKPVDADDGAPLQSPATAPPASGRYGLFGLLDHRSVYGTDWYPEPLSADEADVDNEITASWFHFEKHGEQSDTMSLEFEKSFGLLTLEIAPGYASDHTASFNPRTTMEQRDNQAGWTNIELGARGPVFQYVSPDNFFDTTFVVGLEVSPPTQTKISKDTEFVPKVFNLMRIGNHLAIQTGLGDSILAGPVSHGLSTLEYDAVFAYELTKRELPLPGILSTWPMLEFDGEYPLNQSLAGHDQLFCTAGARFVFDSISWLPAQPRIGIGYTVPIDQGARQELRWSVVTSMIFEY